MYDILIKNGMIVDGTGTPWERGDIGIKGGFIVAIGPSLKTPAHLEIDAKGILSVRALLIFIPILIFLY